MLHRNDKFTRMQRIDMASLKPKLRSLDPRRRGRSRPRSVDVFCSDESPMAPQLFCPVSLNVIHRDSRGRRTTTSPQFRSLA